MSINQFGHLPHYNWDAECPLPYRLAALVYLAMRNSNSRPHKQEPAQRSQFVRVWSIRTGTIQQEQAMSQWFFSTQDEPRHGKSCKATPNFSLWTLLIDIRRICLTCRKGIQSMLCRKWPPIPVRATRYTTVCARSSQPRHQRNAGSLSIEDANNHLSQANCHIIWSLPANKLDFGGCACIYRTWHEQKRDFKETWAWCMN